MTGRRGRRPPSGLTPEELDLWNHAARTLEPLRKAKDRVIDGADEMALEPVAVKVRRKAKPVADLGAGHPARPKAPAASPAAKPATGRAPELAAFDRKSARRIRAGRTEIDARIDLHGMRQDEAHDALYRFLRVEQAAGSRWVLVITGKGGPAGGGGRGAEREHGQEPRGVLKRNVPRWLAEPQLRALVVSYTDAAIGHGGTGALYVQLRRKG